MTEETVRYAVEVMHRVKMFTTKGDTIFAIAETPEQVQLAKNAIYALSDPPDVVRIDGERPAIYKLSDVPYVDSPGGRQKWELRGWPNFLLDAARAVASEQSVAKGFAPIPGVGA